MIISEAQFIREFEVMQDASFIFFLGAGASRTSGIPTANEMIWFFKRAIYCSVNNISPESCKDLANANVQQIIDSWIKNQPEHRNIKWEEEYSHFFEAAYPTKDVRKEFIENYVSQAIPTIGYKCLGALIRAGKIRDIFITNFDRLIEAVCPNIFVISDESADRAYKVRVVDNSSKLIKLHGDFRYDHLRNTTEELRQLNQILESKMKEFLSQFGIVIVGYSGRDDSIMKVLKEIARDNLNSFPKGFYWCILKGERKYERVESLIKFLRESGRNAAFIEITSFDDFMINLYRFCGIKDEQVEAELTSIKGNKTPFFYKPQKTDLRPHLKTNWIKIKEYPTTVYSFKTDISEWSELDELVKGQPVLASFAYPKSIIAIGNRSVVENLFKDHILEPIQIRNITYEDIARINRDHGFVYSLFYSIFDRYFQERLKLQRFKKRCYWDKSRAEKFNSRWMENCWCFIHSAFNYALEYRDKELFIIIEPTVVVTKNKEEVLKSKEAKIAKNEYLSVWYNARWNEELNKWLNIIYSESKGIIGFPPNSEPPSARFVISDHFCFSSPKGGGN